MPPKHRSKFYYQSGRVTIRGAYVLTRKKVPKGMGMELSQPVLVQRERVW